MVPSIACRVPAGASIESHLAKSCRRQMQLTLMDSGMTKSRAWVLKRSAVLRRGSLPKVVALQGKNTLGEIIPNPKSEPAVRNRLQ